MKMRSIYLLIAVLLGSLVARAEINNLRGTMGTYDNEPRLPNHHVDGEKLLAELTEQHANTYNWLVWHGTEDWNDLKKFLPLARKQHINVWVTIVPPTEAPPHEQHFSEPYRLDYVKWAEEIGKLSVENKNVVAWSIDDFFSNVSTFTPALLEKMRNAAHAANPKLAFVPCCYFRDVTPTSWKVYGAFFDGILFPYLAESGKPNLTDATLLDGEVRKIKSIVGAAVPVIVDVYATPHSQYPGGSQPAYIGDVMERSHRAADGILIYCHQGKAQSLEKFNVIKEEFQQWSGKQWRDAKTQRAENIRGCIGTYGAPPHFANGHVDLPQLLAQLEEIHANTYHWLIRGQYGLDDFKKFLPLAREKRIKVWATLVPPSEPPASEPFKLDYERWAKEFAEISRKETNFVAWSVDDFPYNLKLFTPDYLTKCISVSQKINPALAFVPCCYYKQVTAKFIEKYKPYLDGILFPYRADSAGGNLQDATLVQPEVENLRKLLGEDFPVVLHVYATRHSRLGASSPEYIEEVMVRGKQVCDGVLIYCHQDPKTYPEKYAVLKKLFGEWRESSLPAGEQHDLHNAATRRLPMYGCMGTYGTPPRLPNGRADLQKLLNELVDIHANTFHYAVHQNETDWDDLKLLLPMAREKKINVWITIMPPSESPPRLSKYSEPFRLDYDKWAAEIAKLSLTESNLVAWSIDDFTHNQKFFTPKKVAAMMRAAHDVNPRLAFAPCCYFKEITPEFAKNYRPLLDGVLFPYRDESAGGNLKNPDDFSAELKRIRERFGTEMPILLDVYATAHSRLGETTPEYVEKVVADGLRLSDGVQIYKHQEPEKNPEKYAIIKRLFGQWATLVSERKP